MTDDFEVNSGNSGGESGSSTMEQKVLESPPRVLIPEDSESPAKLAPNHSIFMASINRGSPAGKKNGESAVVGMGSQAARDNSTPKQNGSMLSTRVIESLHDQIDTLTSTNLQLTVQSKNLLDKLDTAQQKESKLLENSASLKHENENLVSMLNRKTRKLKDVEEELASYKKNHDSLEEEKTALQKKWENSSNEEATLRQQMEMVQAQYDALVDSHQYYKSHYGSQISTLSDQLENLKLEQRNYAQRVSEEADSFDVKLLEYDSKHTNLQQAEEARVKYLESRCDVLTQQLDLPSWVQLYRESKNMVLEYAEKMKLKVPTEFETLIQDPELTALEAKNLNSGSNAAVLPLRVGKQRAGGANATTSQSGASGSNAAHGKRSSFYGGIASSYPSSTLPGTLPGVRRSSSRRKPSSRVASDASNSGDSSSNFPHSATATTLRSAATAPSSRVSSTSTSSTNNFAFHNNSSNNTYRKRQESTSVGNS
ncbi:hypothetical protein ZYGR_0AI07260 [Zygosaccharomyces rouxii]|uniref:SWI5-dependent HO expression protein 3 n=1 Tax=Zygosaccharomyces rouxii TaxID=4956 RepID=A0A1Q3ACM8_ZYGRO|nr:hypothetical protein ZYGR_0AI07260 [Zygosaccharomyces rouxii]